MNSFHPRTSAAVSSSIVSLFRRPRAWFTWNKCHGMDIFRRGVVRDRSRCLLHTASSRRRRESHQGGSGCSSLLFVLFLPKRNTPCRTYKSLNEQRICLKLYRKRYKVNHLLFCLCLSWRSATGRDSKPNISEILCLPHWVNNILWSKKSLVEKIKL